MGPSPGARRFVDHALAHVDQSLNTLEHIRKTGEHTVTVDGIRHELRALADRLHVLRRDAGGESE